MKVVRPGQVTDGAALRGLRREVEALGRVNHPVVVQGLRSVAEESARTWCSSISAPAVVAHPPLRAAPEQQYLPLAVELASALHYLRRLGWCTST